MLFPDKKRFAFSILDDTDDSTVGNVKPVYDQLKEYGFRTTKTVWPMDCPEGSRLFFAAETLQDRHYLNFVHDLACDGFEIAFHGATMETSRRWRTEQGLEFFKKEFGSYPRLFCNHGYNRDNLYWGPKRFQTFLLRQVFRVVTRESSDHYQGEIDGSEYFWGDLCKQYIRYVRNFTFSQINILEMNPEMPYKLAGTNFVNHWFSTADAPDAKAFNRLLTHDRIDQLERDGGVCIVSTHLGKGFTTDSKLNSDTAGILQYISRKPGWFVPVSDILDHLLIHHEQEADLGLIRRVRLECRFVLDRLRARSKTV